MDIPEKIEQETRTLRQIPDSFKKIIVVREDKKPRYDVNGFVTIGIRQSLMDEMILLG
ncbi:MAG: hypothetical protein LUG99_12830 [Lachnospiraceae bacterium]|nr:hypothetical protein [Lachnospiraceae bacterium]